jgi:hypothetical protein
MLVRVFHWTKKGFLLILVSTFLISCSSTLTYQDIQKDFNNSVQLEKINSVEGIGAMTSSSLAGYEQVIDKLNNQYLQSLDPSLRLNAYAMKAVAQWRTGRLTEAKRTAATALAFENLPSNPRDKMVLVIIGPLVNVQDLSLKYRQVPEPKKIAWNDYKNIYEKDYADAASDLKSAVVLAPPDLPDDMLFYVHYQRWRVLQDWRIVSLKLWDGKDWHSEESKRIRNQAQVDASVLLNGVELSEEVVKEKQRIPEGNWLRGYIEYKERE